MRSSGFAISKLYRRVFDTKIKTDWKSDDTEFDIANVERKSFSSQTSFRWRCLIIIINEAFLF